MKHGTRNLKPGTYKMQPEILTLEPETWNQKPGTRNMKPETWNMEPGIWNRSQTPGTEREKYKRRTPNQEFLTDLWYFSASLFVLSFFLSLVLFAVSSVAPCLHRPFSPRFLFDALFGVRRVSNKKVSWDP